MEKGGQERDLLKYQCAVAFSEFSKSLGEPVSLLFFHILNAENIFQNDKHSCCSNKKTLIKGNTEIYIKVKGQRSIRT